MMKIKHYIFRNWFWLTVGLVFTRFAVEKCYEARGGFFIGGEWFILPLILMTKYLIPAFISEIVNVLGEEDDKDAKETVENRRGMARKRSKPHRR